MVPGWTCVLTTLPWCGCMKKYISHRLRTLLQGGTVGPSPQLLIVQALRLQGPRPSKAQTGVSGCDFQELSGCTSQTSNPEVRETPAQKPFKGAQGAIRGSGIKIHSRSMLEELASPQEQGDPGTRTRECLFLRSKHWTHQMFVWYIRKYMRVESLASWLLDRESRSCSCGVSIKSLCARTVSTALP